MLVDWLDEFFADWNALSPEQREKAREDHASRTREFIGMASCVDPVHVDLRPKNRRVKL